MAPAISAKLEQDSQKVPASLKVAQIPHRGMLHFEHNAAASTPGWNSHFKMGCSGTYYASHADYRIARACSKKWQHVEELADRHKYNY